VSSDKPKRRRRRADGLATKQRILDVATTMFAAGGYEATSLRQIAAAADIDIATLKYHFADKGTLFAEAYRVGHEALVKVVLPMFESMTSLQSRSEVRAHIREQVRVIHDFMDDHMTFVRMVLYRMLEDTSDIIGLEDELQGIAVAMLERVFKGLIERGIIEPIDVRALITLMVSSFSMWFVTSSVKPRWIGTPQPSFEGAGRARSEAFFNDVFTRLLLGDASELG